jgi:FkbM family methyltransferase
VEASPRNFSTLLQRLRANGVDADVRPVQGLVGRRSGSATFYEERIYGSSGLFATDTRRPSTIPYVDLEPLFADVPTIHLIKCDIEGSEQLLIENNEAILRKAQVFVGELHADACDVDACKQRLAELGFVHQEESNRRGALSLLCAWRETADGAGSDT